MSKIKRNASTDKMVKLFLLMRLAGKHKKKLSRGQFEKICSIVERLDLRVVR